MLRLTGGEFRGRLIQTPEGLKTRPTQARLRQALFNSIQASIPDARVLDLFAGSGALGFEALSRGAAHVVFVESSARVLKLIEKNIQSLEVKDRVTVLSDPVDKSWNELRRLAEKVGAFDVVLADPPYAGGWEERLLEELPWEALLKPEGVFCLEWGVVKSRVSELPDETPFLVKTREKNYTDSMLTTYQRKGDLAAASESEPKPDAVR